MNDHRSPGSSPDALPRRPTHGGLLQSALIALFTSLASWASGRAADLVWTNVSGGNWTSATNWKPNQVPSTNDTAWITNNGTYTVTLNTNVALTSLRLGGTSGTQTLGQAGFSLTLSGAGSSSGHGVYTLTSGALTGTGSLNFAGLFNWAGGGIGGAGSSLVVAANGGLALSGGPKNFNGGTLVNGGAGTWTAGPIACSSTALWSNAPGGTLDLQADGHAFLASGGSPLLANAGTLRKTVGAGTNAISVACNNSGTVEANSGTVSFGGAFLQSGGQTVLNGGNFAFTQPAQLRGGTLAGAGTVTGSLSNNATVSPGASPGRLAITGDYTEGPNAHLQIELGGPAAGTGHDQLGVGGTARLAGALDLSYWTGFTPVLGNVFTVLVATARSGEFATTTGPTNTLGTIYTAETVLVEPGNVSPTVQLTADPTSIVCRNLVVRGSATDPDGPIANLTLRLDTNVLVSVAGATAQVTVSSDSPADLTFTALATDNQGAQAATHLTVSVIALPLRVLDAAGFQTNGAFKLCMVGEPGTNYQVLASDNLPATNWAVLGTMVESTNGIWRYSDATATNSSHRYYRARQLP
jgi:hypothetical protein